jgi:transcriptional regulator with XRE-family HTH domain
MSQPHPLIAQLATERKQRRIPVSAIATRIGYGYHTIRYWETGEHMPGTEALQAYANALGYQLTLTPIQSATARAERPAS